MEAHGSWDHPASPRQHLTRCWGIPGSLWWVQDLFHPWGLIHAGQCSHHLCPSNTLELQAMGKVPPCWVQSRGGFSAKSTNYKSIKQGTQRDRTRKHEISEMPHTAEQVEVSARQDLTITRLNELFSYFSFCFLLSCNFKTWINFLQHFAFFFCQPGFQITLLQLKMGLIKVIQVWRYWQFAWQTGCG